MKVLVKQLSALKNNSAPIYIICYVNGKRCRFHTGVYCPVNSFDKNRGIVKGTTKEIKDKNLMIKNVHRLITEIEVRYRLQNLELTAELLVAEYSKPAKLVDFLIFYQEQLDLRSNSLSPSAIEKHSITLKKIKIYQEKVLMVDMTEDFLRGFSSYWLKHGNCQNTVNSNLKNIKVYTRIAHRQKLLADDPFEYFKISTINPVRSFLDERELKMLLNYFQTNKLSEKHENILRTFLFSCFTGLRFSDVCNLNKENIINNFLVFIPQKTAYKNKVSRVPLSSIADSLLLWDKKRKKIFITYSSQFTNRELKNIVADVGIRKNVTFHTARHTFATYYLRKTNDLVGLQKLLGHSSLSDTMIYLHLLDDDIAKNIKTLDDIFLK